jgi:hypothetical protein
VASVLQSVRVSVGRSWRFITPEGKATVMEDLASYRRHIDNLKGGPPGDGFRLPWPPYRSTLWGNLIGEAYKNTATWLLVRTLLPLLVENMAAPRLLKSQQQTPFAILSSTEAFLHPFAVTTLLHLRLFEPEPWQEESQAANVLHDLLLHPLSGEHLGQVRDGVPLALLPDLPGEDFDRRPASFQPAAGFVVLSGLHQETGSGALAYRLASLFQKKATDKSQPMNTEDSAISVTERRVGILLPRADRAELRIECLHHNIATLLAYIENLAAIVPEQATEPCNWFQENAALILNHLYRRRPLPKVNGIYKSRVSEMWIDYRGFAGAINMVNGREQPSPPRLPEK